MKVLIILISLILTSNLFANSICKENLKGNVVCQDSETRKIQPQQYFYDEDMKSSGKWELIAHTFYFTTVLGLGATYYCLDRVQKYETESGAQKENLTKKEIEQYKKWDRSMQTAIAVTGGSLIIGLIGNGLSFYYENEAHEYSLGFNKEF